MKTTVKFINKKWFSPMLYNQESPVGSPSSIKNIKISNTQTGSANKKYIFLIIFLNRNFTVCP